MEQIRVIKELRDESRKKLGTDDPRRIVPRFMVWENVPGAFSSNNGEDFRAVLEETARIADKTATIPRPSEKKGKLQWSTSGCIMGDGWSIAWRVHDAQFWGVPQRRKRIALVADFAGGGAPEILFERESLPRDSEQSETEREEVAGNVGAGIDKAITFQERSGEPGGGKGILIQNDRTGALSTVNNQMVFDASRRHSYQPFEDVCETVQAHYGSGGGNVPMVVNSDCYAIQGNCIDRADTAGCNGKGWREDKSYTLNTMDRHAVCVGNGQLAQAKLSEKVGTLNCMHDQQAIMISTKGNNNAGTQSQILRLLQETYGEETILEWGVAVLDTLQQADILQQGVHESGIQSETKNWKKLDDGSLPCSKFVAEWLLRDMRKREKCGCTSQGQESTEQRLEQFDESMPELSQQNPQTCKDLFDMWEKGERLGLLRQALSEIQEVWQSFDGKGQSVHGCSIVRRLTPLEAERLQNYPDGYTDIGEWVDSKGKKHKAADSPRYKALGNSIALPFWQWMAERMVRLIKNDEPEKEPTMASLFSGIGGFELVFARAGAKPIWNSEIESFPEAVTRVHFGNGENDDGDYKKYL